MGRRLLLVVNPRSRSGQRRFDDVAAFLRERGHKVMESRVTHPSHIPRVLQSRAGELDTAVLAGGDGTINTALGALLQTGLSLGILPTGTANDLARTLGIPTDLSQAAAIVAGDRTVRIDIGRVNEAYFANIASIGISVELTRRISDDLKRRWGVLSYPRVLASIFKDMRPFEASVMWDGNSRQFRSVQVTVGNGRYHGGGMMVAYDASIDDGLLFLNTIQPRSLPRLSALLPLMRVGLQHRSAAVEQLRGPEFELVTSRPMAVETDGEITTGTPARFSVARKALEVFVPAGVDQGGGLP